MNRYALISMVIVMLSRAAAGDEYSLPERVSVLPVAFVPRDEKPPTDAQQALFLKHIKVSQDRYRVMLDGDTFDLAKPDVQIIQGAEPLDFYRKPPERGAPDIVSELLNHFKRNRFNCPYVFCILLMNSKDSFPEGGGRSINGGINTGGGMMYIGSMELTRNEHFQTTLQHELGHAFGLPHVDVYGYDMKTNASIMSYNPQHHCKGFTPSETPGTLIPEDRRALALNNRVFARTTFKAIRDVPAGYALSDRIIPLGPMNLPGHADFYPAVTTTGGEAVGSKVIHIVRERIKPSAGPGITYDPSTMWHSAPLAEGKAVLDVTFAFPVRLTSIAIHSQHSGIHHEATAMRLEAADQTPVKLVIDTPIKSIDETVSFDATTSQKWRITLTAGVSRILIIRGLRFFNGRDEVCPRMVPYLEQPEVLDEKVSAQSTERDQLAATGSSDKEPVPEGADLDQARKSFKDRFKVEIGKAKKPEAKVSLARTFVEQLDAAPAIPDKYVLLTEAVTLAAQGGDLDLALETVRTLTQRFDVDPIVWKEKAVVALGSSSLTLDPDRAEALLLQITQLSDEAQQADAYASAVNMMRGAADLLKKPALKALKDDALFVTKQLTALRDAYDATRMARETLERDPENPAANLTWGRFVCLVRGNFEKGLPLLAKANDKVWAPIAKRENNPPTTSNEWLELGDEWFSAGSREKDVIRQVVLERADRAWQQALSTATDLRRTEIQQKVDQRVVKLFGSSFAITRGDSAGATIAGSDRFSPGEYFTIEFWVSTLSETGTLISKRHGNGDSTFLVHLDKSVPNLSVAIGGGESGSGGGAAINDGKWHHIAIVKKGEDLTLFVDGDSAAKSRVQAPLASQSPWKFGCSRDRPGCAARFGGVRISKIARYSESFTPTKLPGKDKDTVLP